MLELLSNESKIDAIKLHHEALVSIRRAGADAILTYAAIKVARAIKGFYEEK